MTLAARWTLYLTIACAVQSPFFWETSPKTVPHHVAAVLSGASVDVLADGDGAEHESAFGASHEESSFPAQAC